MLPSISGGILACLEYPSKQSRLNQGLDYSLFTVFALVLIVLKKFKTKPA